MRILPLLTALVVMIGLYLLTFERERVLRFAGVEPTPEVTTTSETAAPAGGQTEDTASEAVDEGVSVIAMHSAAREIDSAVLLRGRTEPWRKVDLRAETSGQVNSEPLRKGTNVAEGDVLCRLDPGTRDVALKDAEARLAEARARVPAAEAALAEAESRVPAAEARVAEARARLAEAEINQNAALRLSEGGFASETRVASAKAALESARAGVENALSQLEGARAAVQSAKSNIENARAGIKSAEAAVAAAKKEIEHLTIAAPFAGLLENDAAELGSLLQPGALCATLVGLDPIRLVGFVPEIDVNKVKLGVMAGGRLTDGRELVGRVTFLSRAADETTRTFRVEVEVPNPDLAVRAGQTVEILVKSDGRMAHLLPQSSLTLNDDGDLGVRIVGTGEDGSDVARFAPVELIRDTTEGVWVSGLADKADVIIVGQDYVADGVKLAVTYKEPDA